MSIDPYILERISRIPSDPSWDADRRNPENAGIYADFFTDPAPYEFPSRLRSATRQCQDLMARSRCAFTDRRMRVALCLHSSGTTAVDSRAVVST